MDFTILFVFVGIILIIIFLIYNGLVGMKNSVKNAWASIDVQLKRRSDLIPNLVKTVKGYAKFEKKTLKEITELRNLIKQNQKNAKKAAAAEEILENKIKSVFAVAESYPDLKANKNFIELQNALVDTEDEIAAARRVYNNNVRDYNTKIDSFPQMIIARAFGFTKEEYFKATQKEKKEISESVKSLEKL